MADKTLISQTLRNIVLRGKDTIENIILCTVTSVSGYTCECQPLDEAEAPIVDVRIVSEDDTTTFLLTPTVGSVVGVAPLTDDANSEFIIVLFGGIDTVAIRGDQYGGLVKVSDLVDKLNDIENKVNDILNGFNSHIHPTPSGASSPPTTPLVGTLTNTTVNDLENDNVLHG